MSYHKVFEHCTIFLFFGMPHMVASLPPFQLDDETTKHNFFERYFMSHLTGKCACLFFKLFK